MKTLRVRLLLMLWCVLTLSPGISLAEGSAVVTFVDPVVEETIRAILSMPEGPIHEEDMKRVEAFVYPPVQEELAVQNSSPQILSIADLRHCINLKTLSVDAQPFDSLAPLQALTSLERITLNQCENIADVTPLASHKTLQTVVLNGTRVTDFSPVFQLPGLKEFVAIGVRGAPDLSPLSQTDTLEVFMVNDVGGRVDYTPLASHRGMRRVALYFIDSKSFQSLMKSWPALESLTVLSSPIESADLEALSSHSLSQIRLHRCAQIVDLSPLSSQQALQSFTANLCGIEDVTPLSQITSLTVRIDLRQNPIQDLSPLQALSELKTLIISKNEDHYTLESLQRLLPAANIIIE